MNSSGASSSESEQTYYDVLGIDRHADDKAVRRAYLKASLKHHPDKNPENVEGAKLRFVEAGEAYDVLGDPDRRAAYDRALAAGTARRRRREGVGQFPGDFDAYMDAFDAHVAGMSEEELRTAAGVAAAVGSVVGSIVASRLGGNGGGGAGGGLARSAGSLIGSAVGSRAAAGLVRSLHEQSLERVSYEERKRAAMERGEAVPEKHESSIDRAWKHWDDLKNVIGKATEEGSEGNASGGSRARGVDSNYASKRERWGQMLGVAASVAGTLADGYSSTKRQSHCSNR